MAAVRDPARHLSEILVLSEADVTARVAQLPHTAGEPWLGGSLADPGSPTLILDDGAADALYVLMPMRV